MTLAGTVSGQECLVIGPGKWTSGEPSSFWSTPHAILLTRESESNFRGLAGRDAWSRAEILLEKPIWEGQRAWLWTAPSQDSLLVLRPAILSEGVSYIGSFVADTLLGRAFAFSDVISRINPRANAYGIRYDCGNAHSAETAFAKYWEMRHGDLPDAAIGAVEDSIRWVDIERRFLEFEEPQLPIPTSAERGEIRVRVWDEGGGRYLQLRHGLGATGSDKWAYTTGTHVEGWGPGFWLRPGDYEVLINSIPCGSQQHFVEAYVRHAFRVGPADTLGVTVSIDTDSLPMAQTYKNPERLTCPELRLQDRNSTAPNKR